MPFWELQQTLPGALGHAHARPMRSWATPPGCARSLSLLHDVPFGFPPPRSLENQSIACGRAAPWATEPRESRLGRQRAPSRTPSGGRARGSLVLPASDDRFDKLKGLDSFLHAACCLHKRKISASGKCTHAELGALCSRVWSHSALFILSAGRPLCFFDGSKRRRADKHGRRTGAPSTSTSRPKLSGRGIWRCWLFRIARWPKNPSASLCSTLNSPSLREGQLPGAACLRRGMIP